MTTAMRTSNIAPVKKVPELTCEDDPGVIAAIVVDEQKGGCSVVDAIALCPAAHANSALAVVLATNVAIPP